NHRCSCFFFQAEDGIRDFHVTGVQTCALPIYNTATVAFILQEKRLLTVREGDLADFRLLRMRARRGQVFVASPQDLMITMFEQRSEERRVGKEFQARRPTSR